jgi:hypothetical protein
MEEWKNGKEGVSSILPFLPLLPEKCIVYLGS